MDQLRILAASITNGPGGDVNLPVVSADGPVLKMILQLVLGIIAGITVIYIFYSAIRITLSQGDPQAIAKERQAVLYAVVGLIVVVSAEVIVTFALGKL